MTPWLTAAFAAIAAQDQTPKLEPVKTSIVITGKTIEPSVDHRNKEVFEHTLFSRDDQVLHQLNAGIHAVQHEGGGKSIEIRRFGYNLDHGGVSGGLKILVDNVQQNQSTQGHGQGYLGSLKSIAPELVQEASIINGPFSAEYGDFSGLGVVHIRLRESMPDEWTARLQGGSFNSQRGFLAFSPNLLNTDALFAYEGSHSDGPFLKPLDYRRDNLTANITQRLARQRSAGFKFNAGRNSFSSSGQIPLDAVQEGILPRFGFLDPGEGGRVRSATAGLYYRQDLADGAVWKIDGFLSRSLFDLYSNFTYFLNDPMDGDGIQQHDSRLQQGANAQYIKPHKLGSSFSQFSAGANYHGNQINVGLYPRIGRTPTGVTTRAHANVTNTAGYAQETFSLLNGKLIASAGLRYDLFRFHVADRLSPSTLGQTAGNWQPKASLAYTPTRRLPITFHANYGRGISSLDARSMIQSPGGARVSTTDFQEVGVSYNVSRFSAAFDAFLIDRSHELVYVADDGSLEFLGPSRAYGYEGKLSLQLNRKLSFSGGFTQVLNAFYRATSPREYVDRAPRFVPNAGLTLAAWRGWTGSLRVRAINRYRLDPLDATIRAAGHTVWDMSLVRRLTRSVDFNFALDNMLNREYYETQNYIESRLQGAAPRMGIHGTPGYPRTITAGLTVRFRGK
ncbi:MAG: hypothetical protein FJW40_03425 [Acidobacteria bacterium]|nr:hypothetical protein [Acidobacteriota bacterium]